MSRIPKKSDSYESQKQKNDTLDALDRLSAKTKQSKQTEVGEFQNSRKTVYTAFGIIAILIASFSFYAIVINPNGDFNPFNPQTPPTLKTYTDCTGSTITTHYHFHLFIYVHNVLKPIPADMGIRGNCVASIHTHDNTGEIHIEMPPGLTTHPTLSDVFNVYRTMTDSSATFSANSLMDFQGNVTCTVNNSNLTNFVNYIPNDGDTINLRV